MNLESTAEYNEGTNSSGDKRRNPFYGIVSLQIEACCIFKSAVCFKLFNWTWKPFEHKVGLFTIEVYIKLKKFIELSRTSNTKLKSTVLKAVCLWTYKQRIPLHFIIFFSSGNYSTISLKR